VDERATKKQQESSQDRAIRITAASTKWIAVFTLVIVLANVGTLYILKRQLDEMAGSGKQTDSLICLYRKQLEQLTRQAGDTHELAVQAKNQADRTKDVADRTRDEAKQAKRSADISDKALEANVESFLEDQRPWVGIQAIQCDGCATGPPAQNQDSRSISVTVTNLTAVLENTGKTPALQVKFFVTDINTHVMDTIPSWDSNHQNMTNNALGRLEPKYRPSIESAMAQVDKVSPVAVIAPNAIQKLVLVKGRFSYPQRGPVGLSQSDMNKTLVMYVIGKITYADTRKRPYTTQFCFWSYEGPYFEACPTGNDMK
jgi:hypothetical protein